MNRITTTTFTDDMSLHLLVIWTIRNTEVANGGVISEKVFLEILQYSPENTCARVSFLNKIAGLRSATLLKKGTLAQMFSCEFCKISKNTFD